MSSIELTPEKPMICTKTHLISAILKGRNYMEIHSFDNIYQFKCMSELIFRGNNLKYLACPSGYLFV